MTVDIASSMLTEKALDYAELSSLAYSVWTKVGSEWVPEAKYQSLWDKMHDKGYSVVAYCPNDPTTGYSGTIFYNSNTQQYILANRGTELSVSSFEADYNDINEDKEILNGFTPAKQFTSMMEFIAQNNLNMYQFDVTGHSLGGCLAQMAKATYSGNVDEVYTYNAPGAKELKQNYFFKRLSATPGMVVLEYFQGTVWIETEWKQETWDLYQTFLNNKQSVNDTKVYNIIGKDWLKIIANWKPNIGGEVFINGAWHGIASMISNLETGKYYIDSRRLMPVIKVASNTGVYQTMSDDMDGNAGVLTEGTQILELRDKMIQQMIRIINGEPTKAEGSVNLTV